MSYYLTKKVESTFEQTLEKATAALKDQGFGVLTEIDVPVPSRLNARIYTRRVQKKSRE